MPDAKTNRVPVPIQVQLPPALVAAIEAGGAMRDDLCSALARATGGLLAVLGLPGRAAISLGALDGYRRAYPIRIRVHEQQLHCAPEILARVHCAAQRVPLNTTPPLHLLEAWLDAASDGQAAAFLTAHRHDVLEFLSLALLETLKQQPSVLLDDAMTDVLQSAWLKPDARRPAAWLRPILSAVLDAWLSFAGKSDRIAAELAGNGTADRAPAEIAENLIAALRPATVDIRLPEADLRALTLGNDTSMQDTFELLRDGLFYELGLTYPDFRFVPADDLQPGTFAFRINHVTTLPYAGLNATQYLVNAAPETLHDIGLPAQPATNPANWHPVSLIGTGGDDSVVSTIRERGYWTWDPAEYLVLAFSTSLRERSPALITAADVRQQVDELEEVFPALIRAYRAHYTIAQLTRIERALVAENLSVRDLRRILERLIDYDYIVADPHGAIVFDDRIVFPALPDETTLASTTHLMRSVRIGLKRYLGYRASDQNAATLTTHLLDDEFESVFYAALKDGTLSPTFRERVLDALETAFAHDPLPAAPRNILVGQILRAPLRDIAATEFPRLRVWAFEELPNSLSIVPATRISL